jgi:glucosamine-6-phosphate deaminase
MNYFNITSEELGKNSKIPILKLGDSGEVFYEIALEMANEIKVNNSKGKNTVFICPVGPVGQYPIFIRLVNKEGISLKNSWFINMDEYLDDNGEWIDKNHRLSFRGYMDENVYSRIRPELLMEPDQRIFPDPKDLGHIPFVIKKLGGVDIAFGGVGINGHLAFNEPQDELTVQEFSQLSVRVLEISHETRTINSVGDLNGAIDAMPRKSVTVGMKQILSARKIRLAVFRDWHRAVIRQAAYGEISAHFPVTLAQTHDDALIITNKNAAQQPF